MKFLFFNEYNVTPHLDTELEIAKKLKSEGHEIFMAFCNKQLQTCFGNPEHIKATCRICVSQRLNGFRLLNIPSSNIFELLFDGSIEDLEIPEYNSLQELKDFRFQGMDIGMGVVSSLVSEVREHKLDPRNYREKIRTGIRTSIFAYYAFNSLIDKIKPDGVYLFNGRFLEVRPLIRICEQRGIDYFTHERGGSIETYLLRKNSTPHSLKQASNEIYELWGTGGNKKIELGKKFFVDRRNRVQQSWYVFTAGQQSGSLPAGFDPGKRNIAFFNSSMDEYEGIAGFTNKLFTDDNEGIKWIINSFADTPEFHFYLRIHPNLKNLQNSQIEELNDIGKNSINITLIHAEETVDTYALMDACEKIIVFNSTMGAEAVYWNKPVILLGHAFYESLEGFYKAEIKEQAIELIKRKLAPLGREDIIKYGYWELNKGLKHEFYRAESLTSGKFLEKKIGPDILVKTINWIEHYLKRVKSLIIPGGPKSR